VTVLLQLLVAKLLKVAHPLAGAKIDVGVNVGAVDGGRDGRGEGTGVGPGGDGTGGDGAGGPLICPIVLITLNKFVKFNDPKPVTGSHPEVA